MIVRWETSLCGSRGGCCGYVINLWDNQSFLESGTGVRVDVPWLSETLVWSPRDVLRYLLVDVLDAQARRFFFFNSLLTFLRTEINVLVAALWDW